MKYVRSIFVFFIIQITNRQKIQQIVYKKENEKHLTHCLVLKIYVLITLYINSSNINYMYIFVIINRKEERKKLCLNLHMTYYFLLFDLVLLFVVVN